MGGTHPKAALLLLCLFFLALVACSKEPPGEPDRAETRDAPRGTLAGRAGDPGVSGEAPRRPTIEGARLQTGEEGEKIIVVVGHEAFFPECFLMEARAMRGAGRGGVYGRGAKSRWPKEGATETAQVGKSYVVVFHEDPHPGAKVADPRKTPYSVLCVEAITKRAVEAHVEGTPEASPPLRHNPEADGSRVTRRRTVVSCTSSTRAAVKKARKCGPSRPAPPMKLRKEDTVEAEGE